MSSDAVSDTAAYSDLVVGLLELLGVPAGAGGPAGSGGLAISAEADYKLLHTFAPASRRRWDMRLLACRRSGGQLSGR